MTYLPRFAFPEYLLLLTLIPLAIYLGLRLRSLNTWRKGTAITLRSIILAAMVLAPAGMEIVKTSNRLAVFFLLDHSNSVPEDLRLSAAQAVRNAAEAHMESTDEAGVIVFGENASIELSIAPTLGMRDIKSFVGGEATDLAAAIRLATAAFPQGYMRRMVVFSDGNETRGSALEEIKAARAAGIEVDTVPLQLPAGSDVRLREVRTPGRVDANEPFPLQVVVHADAESEAELTLYQRAGAQRQQMPPQKVHLRKGENVFQVQQDLQTAGVYEYEARLDAPGDTVQQNNVGRGYCIVQGPSKVLYVEADKASTRLGPALREEGLQVEEMTPESLPANLAFYQAYDAMVFSNVSALQLGAENMKVIEAAVRDLGIGLVMIGGPDAFGAGGFLDTPIEKALPVSMDVKQRKILPRGALGLILHTCEIPEGNVWAREIALSALNVLASQDLMGGWGYTYQGGGDTELFPLQPVGDKAALRDAVIHSSEIIGDMPDVTATMRMAYQSLAKADAAVKRIVMISDGDPAAPPSSLLKEIADAKISVSTVCIAPHSGSDRGMLEDVANSTGGQYYFVNSADNLPQIFAKEAAVVRRGILNEVEFTPAVHAPSEVLQGVVDGAIPVLRGYVITTAKDAATVPLVSGEGDPVLAHWRYGLGKAVAFTSDVTPRWAGNWLAWERFSRYWVQAVRFAMREAPHSPFQVDTRVVEGRGHVRIDAVDAAGKFVNFLSPAGVATGPDLAPVPLNFTQTGPGIYEADFAAESPGTYFTNVSYTAPGGESGALSSGLSVNYAREYEYTKTNAPFLESLAAAGAGQVFSGEFNPFEHTLKASATVTPLWPYLLALAVALLPIEIFVRRVMLPWLPVYRALYRVLRRVPGLGARMKSPETFRRAATGAYLAGGAPVAAAAAPEPVSFGTVREAASPPAEKKQKKPAPPAQTHTSELLAAKERARAREKRRTGQGEDDKDKP